MFTPTQINAMRENDDLVLFLAAHQTNGRGRGANHWLDTGAGESLLSTWSLSVSSPPQAITGPRIGLALFAAATHAWPSLKFGLKAPNDLYLDGQKVAGLLVETVTGSCTSASYSSVWTWRCKTDFQWRIRASC